MCVIRLFCKKIFDDLISHGCCQNKSLIKSAPIGIPNELMRHFIRGYFDGNGSIAYSYNRKVDKSYLKIAITTGSLDFANWLSTTLLDAGINSCDESFLFAVLYNTIINKEDYEKIKNMIKLNG